MTPTAANVVGLVGAVLLFFAKAIGFPMTDAQAASVAGILVGLVIAASHLHGKKIEAQATQAAAASAAQAHVAAAVATAKAPDPSPAPAQATPPAA